MENFLVVFLGYGLLLHRYGVRQSDYKMTYDILLSVLPRFMLLICPFDAKKRGVIRICAIGLLTLLPANWKNRRRIMVR